MNQPGLTDHEKQYPRALQRKVDAIARDEFAKFTFRITDLIPTNPLLFSADLPDMNTFFGGDELQRQKQIDKINAIANDINDPETRLLVKRLEGLSNLKDRVTDIFDEAVSPLLEMIPESQNALGVAAIDNRALAKDALEKYWASLFEKEMLPDRNTATSVDGLSGSKKVDIQKAESHRDVAIASKADELSELTAMKGFDSRAFAVRLGEVLNAFFNRCRDVSGLSAGIGIGS